MKRGSEGGERTKRRKRNITPVAYVFHLDEVEEGEDEDEDGDGDGDEDEDEDEEGHVSEAKAAAGAASQEVRIDAEGRIAGVSDCGLDFRFRSLPPDTVPVDERLLTDCEAAFVGASFWLPADQEPRCSLESLALAIFRHHTRDATFDPAAAAANADGASSSSPSSSGAEWWVGANSGD